MSIYLSNENVLRTNYVKLVKLNICSNSGDLRKCGCSKAEGIRDLFFERQPRFDNLNGQISLAFSISHYFVQNGSFCQNPSMVLLLLPEVQKVETYSFQQTIPPVFKCVYPTPGKCCESLFYELNEYLSSWLKYLINLGHGINWHDNDPSAQYS